MAVLHVLLIDFILEPIPYCKSLVTIITLYRTILIVCRCRPIRSVVANDAELVFSANDDQSQACIQLGQRTDLVQRVDWQDLQRTFDPATIDRDW